jgi:hypothetical protein
MSEGEVIDLFAAASTGAVGAAVASRRSQYLAQEEEVGKWGNEKVRHTA